MKGINSDQCLTCEFKDGCAQRMCMASLIFNWKLVEAESRILKQSSEQSERQFSEPLRYLYFLCMSQISAKIRDY